MDLERNRSERLLVIHRCLHTVEVKAGGENIRGTGVDLHARLRCQCIGPRIIGSELLHGIAECDDVLAARGSGRAEAVDATRCDAVGAD
jgi:hypothetical protein